MERFVLLVSWEKGLQGGRDKKLVPPGFEYVQNVYSQLKEYSAKYTKTFPACSLTGNPVSRRWFCAFQAVHGPFQFSSSQWEDLSPDAASDDAEDPAQSSIEECLSALQNPEEEDDDSSRDSVTQSNLFEESAELLHQLSDKLPAPGRALVDVLLISSEAPRLKDCIPAIGAIKHLKEWHSAKITIVTKDHKGWQQIANYLSACIVPTDRVSALIDPQELWRGSVEISERKFSSQVEFPEFCIRSVSDGTEQPYFLRLNRVTENSADKTRRALLPEVFHYYGSLLEFVQMVATSEIPSYFISNVSFELSLTTNCVRGKSKLMLDQLCSLNEKVGAIFTLPCNVCSLPIPPALQRSTKKWREYMSRKPKEIKVPGMELKGEHCSYFFLVQGKDNGLCTLTMLHSASQINGAASLALLLHRLKSKPSDESKNNQVNALSGLQHYHGNTIVAREKALARSQALAVKEYLQRSKAMPSVAALKTLLTITREGVFRIFEGLSPTGSNTSLEIAGSGEAPAESKAMISNPAEWPERHVLQNLENFEKTKQRIRASILSSSAEHLLGRKDSQKEGITSLDAKELLKYFTPQGLAIGELQPLQIQRGENAFLLTPRLTPRKLKGLPFEKAAECHYHGLEFCLDHRKALDRDVGFVELQSRLIRYETQTTCTRECCPVPFALSPLPSPAVLSEPGSVPDGESLQGDLGADPLRLKRRSKDLEGLYASKRLAKSESSDSLLSLASEGSGCQQLSRVTRTRPEKVTSAPSTAHPPNSQIQSVSNKPPPATQTSNPEQERKESRSQKHNRMLKEVVSKTLKKYGVDDSHPCFVACSQRLFDVSKFFLKDLKTSRGLIDEMKKAAGNNAKQVVQWELDKLKKK
ncbi:mdm2-binding protein [Spea bombifrons]|uniref:mdm2-binding protein n=1 Tax=Spea bombifrons TaxID=233779 RepID=UPI002348F941|nr:mdm2-binding protein [Spea bombifrons]